MLRKVLITDSRFVRYLDTMLWYVTAPLYTLVQFMYIRVSGRDRLVSSSDTVLNFCVTFCTKGQQLRRLYYVNCSAFIGVLKDSYTINKAVSDGSVSNIRRLIHRLKKAVQTDRQTDRHTEATNGSKFHHST